MSPYATDHGPKSLASLTSVNSLVPAAKAIAQKRLFTFMGALLSRLRLCRVSKTFISRAGSFKQMRVSTMIYLNILYNVENWDSEIR